MAPEKIENQLASRCSLIQQLFVHGESLENSLVAVMIPEPETFLPFVQAQLGLKVAPTDLVGISNLCQNPKVNALIIKELSKAGKAAELRGFEMIKRVYLSTDAFTIENGLLTPTLKVKRPQVQAHFAEQIKGMYADIHATTPVAKL